MLCEAMRFLPQGRKDGSITEMRQLSMTLAEQDSNFDRKPFKTWTSRRAVAPGPGQDPLDGIYFDLPQG